MTGETTANVAFVANTPLPIEPLSQEAAQEALADLLKSSAEFPELEAFLNDDSGERQLLLATMTLSPFLRDIAVYDLGRILDTPTITAWLSAFARACVSSAVDHLLLAAHQGGKLALRDTGAPSQGSGLTVIAMGKLGSSELNYSSDIDLVVVFDPDAGIVEDRDKASDVFSRIVRQMIHILQERTGDGYVFRTDLRLRPDPGSTPLAIPFGLALHYYEGRGQNWERAAYVKADVAAGDLRTGRAYCAELTPFVYRKYLDYVAISDIHSIKRQIHAHKGFGEISARGHNIKLGRGGIREIEFFVQTQQLIAGGRMPELRTRATDRTLSALAAAQWISKSTEESLRKAYWFLRDVEHRIQMRRDEQSHKLPEDEEEFGIIARMMGFTDPQVFTRKLVATLLLVEKHYARLFEQEKGLTSGTGNLVFTGDDDDPDTLESLSQMGFERPSDMSRIIRTWHYGRYRATQTAAARKRLTELMPELLQTIAATGRADETLLKFDSFLSGLPSGVQLFSLLGNNPGLMSLLTTIMSSAPRLANVIARNPHVFDGMLDPTLLAELPTREMLSQRLEGFLEGELAYEEVLDRLRIFTSEQQFLVGVRLLTSAITGGRAAMAFSDLAELTLAAVVDAVQEEFERNHGRIAGGRIALMALGKLGSHEMTAASDVDMILLYAHDADCPDSDGPKPLDPFRYYTRFTQRLVSALSAPTAEGVLYEVDLRLRPSGNKGPVATSIGSFRNYQENSAWTWEHMALTRARIIAGDASLKAEAEKIILDVLARERDLDTTAADVAEMRKRIEDEKPPASPWDLRLVPGGLFDIEFIAQFLRLHAVRAETESPEPGTRTKSVLEVLAPPMIGEAEAGKLIEALDLYTQITQITRLCLEGKFQPEDAPQAFRELLLSAVDFPDLATLEASLQDMSVAVREIFQQTIVDGQVL